MDVCWFYTNAETVPAKIKVQLRTAEGIVAPAKQIIWKPLQLRQTVLCTPPSREETFGKRLSATPSTVSLEAAAVTVKMIY
jgi:hypothetical protein